MGRKGKQLCTQQTDCAQQIPVPARNRDQGDRWLTTLKNLSASEIRGQAERSGRGAGGCGGIEQKREKEKRTHGRGQ